MKRKLFFALIMVLVLCLTCGMLLVACDKDPEEEPKPDPTPDPSTPVTDEVATVWPEITEAIDAGEEYSIAIEIKNDPEEVAPLFGLALEVLNGKNIMYAAAGSNVYVKFNGFDLTALFEQIGFIANFDIITTLSGVVGFGVLFESKVTIYNDNVYDFTVNSIGGLLEMAGGFNATIAEKIGMTTEQLDGVIASVAGMLGLKDVTGWSTLLSTIGAAIDKYDISVIIGMGDSVENDENDPYAGLISGITPAVRNGEAKNLFNFSVDGTAALADGTGETVGDYVASIDIDINPFELLTILDSVKKGEDGKMYVDMSNAEIVAMLEKLGYFSFVVDEIKADNTVKRNIITIYSDFASGRVIAQIYGESIIIYDVALGGVFDFDALVGFISDMQSGAITQADEEEEAGESSLIDTVLNVAKQILALTNFNVFAEDFDFDKAAADIKANGLTIKMSGIMDVIAGFTDVDSDVALGFTLRDLIPKVWKEADSLSLKVQHAGFLDAVRVDEKTLSAMTSSPSKALVSEITAIEGLPSAIITADDLMLGIDNTYKMQGTSIATGETVEFDGYILGYSGLDMSKTGEQTITLYVAASNSGKGLIGMITSMFDLTPYPIFGVQAYAYKVNVLANNPEAELTLENLKGGSYLPVALNSDIWSNLVISSSKTAFLVVDGAARTPITEDNMTVKKDGTVIEKTDSEYFDEEGKIIKAGRYTVELSKAGYVYSFDIEVMEITSSTTVTFVAKEGTDDISTWALGTDWNYAGYALQIGDFTFDMEPTAIKIGYTSYTFADICSNIDNNVYTLGKDLSWVDSDLKFDFSIKRSDSTVAKTFTKSIKITSDTKVSTKTGTLYFGQSFDGKFVISVGDTDYTVSYDEATSAWIATDENGNKLEGFSATFEWAKAGSGKFVTANEQGFINNYPNEYKNGMRYTYVYYSLEVNGYKFSGNFTAYELYASDKNSNYSYLTVGKTLEGLISNVKYISDAEGAQGNYVFTYGAAGYGIYTSDGATEVYDVTVKVFDIADGNETDVTATAFDENGAFVKEGSYKVEYEVSINGINQKFFNYVNVKAAA